MMTHLLLINLLLILAGPFAVVGAIALIAEAAGAGIIARLLPPSRSVRPVMRTAVAW